MTDSDKVKDIDPSELVSALISDPESKLLTRMLARKLAEKEWTDSTEVKSRAAELKQRFAIYQKAQTFQPGQLVKWKPHLKNKKRPAYGEPAIVVDVLDMPVFDGEREAGSPYFREPLNIVLGVIDVDGEFSRFHYDSNRLEPAE